LPIECAYAYTPLQTSAQSSPRPARIGAISDWLL
jgi:hypothetical protein